MIASKLTQHPHAHHAFHCLRLTTLPFPPARPTNMHFSPTQQPTSPPSLSTTMTPLPTSAAADHAQAQADAHVNDDEQEIIYETTLFPQNHTVRLAKAREVGGGGGGGEGREGGQPPRCTRICFDWKEREGGRDSNAWEETKCAIKTPGCFRRHHKLTSLPRPTPPLPQLHLLLYEHVQNASQIRTALLDGTLPELALIDPSMVLSSFHLLLAASTALLQQAQGTMRLKTLHAELLYSLSPTTKISEAFRVFGGGGAETSSTSTTKSSSRPAAEKADAGASSSSGSSSSSSSTCLLFAFIDSSRERIRERVIPLVKGKAVAAERVVACLDARPLSKERIERFRKVFKVEEGGREGGKDGGGGGRRKQKKGGESMVIEGGGGGGGRAGRDEAEELEHAVVSRIAAKRLL